MLQPRYHSIDTLIQFVVVLFLSRPLVRHLCAAALLFLPYSYLVPIVRIEAKVKRK